MWGACRRESERGSSQSVPGTCLYPKDSWASEQGMGRGWELACSPLSALNLKQQTQLCLCIHPTVCPGQREPLYAPVWPATLGGEQISGASGRWSRSWWEWGYPLGCLELRGHRRVTLRRGKELAGVGAVLGSDALTEPRIWRECSCVCVPEHVCRHVHLCMYM